MYTNSVMTCFVYIPKATLLFIAFFLLLAFVFLDGSFEDRQYTQDFVSDLRQDMLTLQLLQVMDNLWQAEGLDFR